MQMLPHGTNRTEPLRREHNGAIESDVAFGIGKSAEANGIHLRIGFDVAADRLDSVKARAPRCQGRPSVGIGSKPEFPCRKQEYRHYFFFMFFMIFAQLSRKLTVRLKTSASGLES